MQYDKDYGFAITNWEGDKSIFSRQNFELLGF